MEDKFIKEKDGKDKLEPEVFENVREFKIYTSTFTFVFSDKEIDEILETYNFFTIKYKNNKFFVLKWSSVDRFEFTLT